ncbi:hypothetical protein [Sphingomonas sp. NIBR02145]|uniref:hypothetical protein n=1 Tax=Sphingomonas sp. NIBR02145 TaxID=3014784 RepID=UPI0022B5506A|nr:hypothetical protein [Sphingomonas sp. NIBR02145]WHU03180.1 hypothetical protein O3305_00785 [Sphingomonas sp. NIBR02145]
MPGLTNETRGRRWIGGAALALPVGVALAWMAWPSAPPSREAGVVTIAAGAAQPAAAPLPAPPATKRPPLTPQRNSELADANQYLVTRETRDRAWASRSETRLLAFMRGLAHVDTRSLTARCTTSLCEVSGLAEEDSGGSMNPAWETLERDTASASLEAEGLARDATTFGTGRVREAFVVYFRRVVSPT